MASGGHCGGEGLRGGAGGNCEGEGVSRPLAADGGSGQVAGATMGTNSTVMPSAVEAAAAVESLEESELCTVVVVVDAGTWIVAVMITLAPATLIVTSDLSIPAAVAMLCCRLEVSE